MCSEVEYMNSLSNADAARPEDHSKKDFPGMSNDDLHNTQGKLEQHSEEIALVEPVEKVADEDGYSGYSTDSSMPPLEIPSDELHTSEGPLETFSEEEDSASKDSRNCFSNSTKATDDVFLNVLDDNKVVSGISVSPQINRQLRKDDTAANSNNEQFHKAHVGKTVRKEQVQVTSEQPNCNNELNVCQRNGLGSSSAECTKRRENGDEGRITHSAKNKKELPSPATTIQTSDSVLKKVPEALTRDSPAYRCNICDKTFSKAWRWFQHPRDHLKRFQCRKCGKRYALKWYFIKHQASHTEQKPYKCVICDARFKHYKSKLKHERRFHADATCFECVACEKMFNDKKSIIYHLRVDSGQKPPFRCQSCGKKCIFMVKKPDITSRI
ncbi:zinc finger protein 286A-like [Planococcus citri]|uniref:zinc finger protein 286A-like n=1 Tax=Planococcus citri TaxID=170843 RepID=UPI0031F88EFA